MNIKARIAWQLHNLADHLDPPTGLLVIDLNPIARIIEILHDHWQHMAEIARDN